MSTQKNEDNFDLEFEDVKDSNQQAPSETPEDDLPEKFKGKSLKDVVGMYTNLEGLSSRQANELGEYRKRVDQILGLRDTDNTRKPERKSITATDLLQTPDKVIAEAIDSSEATTLARQAVTTVQEIKNDIAQQSFYTKFPKWSDDVQDPAFLQFVQTNPLRASLGQQAGKDFRAAEALWGLWDEHKALVSKQVQDDKSDKRKEALRGVRTVTNGSTADGQGNKPTFSRAKLLDLQMRAEGGDPRAVSKWNDPEFQRARHEAYAEGRVK